MLKVDCGENALLSGFHFEFSEGGARDPNVANAKLLHEKWRFIAGNSLCEWWIFHDFPLPCLPIPAIG